MKNSKQRTIQEEVMKLLKENGVTEAPVDVEQIADSLGIDVRRSPTDDDISGFLLKQPDGAVVIGVNTLHHPNRQRFTIGHEIGHFLLHDHAEVHVDRSVMRLVKLRDAESSKGEDPEEIEANRFAAELLMPEVFLEGDLQALFVRDLLDDRRMQQLAKRYKVSVQAMTNRLITLGYLQANQGG